MPCVSYRCDKVVQHATSTAHKQGVMLESTASAVSDWLAKSEIAHTTKFQSLVKLAICLGSDYLKELNLYCVYTSTFSPG